MRWLDSFRATIYPDRCHFCGKIVFHKTEICPQCRRTEKPIPSPKCTFCGKHKDDCSCKGRAKFYQGITAPYMYKGNVRKGILSWKYGHYLHSAEFFAKCIERSVRNDFDCHNIDVITFVPQTASETEEKRFNQCEALAVELGKRMDLPVEPLLVKLFETRRQHDLPWYMKSGNVFGVFGCSEPSTVEGKRILLVDDVKTSGTTLNECAKVLHLNSAEAVYCAVIGIT